LMVWGLLIKNVLILVVFFFLLGGGGGGCGGGADSYFLLFAIYDSMHFLLHSMLCYHSIFPAISIFLLHQSLNQG